MKGINNARVDVLSKKAELQGKEKVEGIILKIDNDGKIRYNYL